MKRHHIVAVLLLIFGGLFAYLRFDDGDTNGAIRTGIIFVLLAVTMFFLAKLRPRLRTLGVTLILLIIMGRSAYQDFMAGDMVGVIILGILMILAMVMVLIENTPLYKGKIEPWLKPVSRIGMVVSFAALIVILLILFFV